LVARKFSRLEKNVSCLYFDSHTHTLFISIGLTKRISELQAATKKKNASTKNQKKKTAVANDASSSALVESLGGGDPSKFIEFLIAQIQQKAAAQVVSPAERRRKYFEKIVVGKLKELLATANITVKANLKKDDLVQLAVDCLQIKVPGMDDVSSTSVLISATTAMDTEAHQARPSGQVQQIAASSESSHQALEDGAVDAAPKADSSSTSDLISATTAMDTEAQQTQPLGQVQQIAASSESSHQALEDGAVDAAPKADVSSTSVLISVTAAMDTQAHQARPPGQVQQIAASSESSHQAPEDGAVDAASKADSSSTSDLISATTAMDTEAQQTQPLGQVQQIAASSESSHQALEDGAVEAAPKADSSSTSGLVDTTTVTLIQEGADSNDQQFTLTAGDIFTLRIEEYILSDKPTVRKDCKVLRIDQHPRLKRQVQIWYSYTWKARNGIIHNEDDGVLDIVFQDGMSN
jgi:hypothetical protein